MRNSRRKRRTALDTVAAPVSKLPSRIFPESSWQPRSAAITLLCATHAFSACVTHQRLSYEILQEDIQTLFCAKKTALRTISRAMVWCLLIKAASGLHFHEIDPSSSYGLLVTQASDSEIVDRAENMIPGLRFLDNTTNGSWKISLQSREPFLVKMHSKASWRAITCTFDGAIRAPDMAESSAKQATPWNQNGYANEA